MSGAPIAVALWLRILRKARKWKLKDLEFESGVPTFIIQEIENGEREMEWHTSNALAKALLIEESALSKPNTSAVIQILKTLPALPQYSQVPRRTVLRVSPLSGRSHSEKTWRQLNVLFRKERNLTIKQLATRCNMKVSEVRRTEKGHPEAVERHWLKLVRALKLRPSDYDWRTWPLDSSTLKASIRGALLAPERRHLHLLWYLSTIGPLPKMVLREHLKAENISGKTTFPISLRLLIKYRYIEQAFLEDKPVTYIRQWHPEYSGQMVLWYQITDRGREALRQHRDKYPEFKYSQFRRLDC